MGAHRIARERVSADELRRAEGRARVAALRRRGPPAPPRVGYVLILPGLRCTVQLSSGPGTGHAHAPALALPRQRAHHALVAVYLAERGPVVPKAPALHGRGVDAPRLRHVVALAQPRLAMLRPACPSASAAMLSTKWAVRPCCSGSATQLLRPLQIVPGWGERGCVGTPVPAFSHNMQACRARTACLATPEMVTRRARTGTYGVAQPDTVP